MHVAHLSTRDDPALGHGVTLSSVQLGAGSRTTSAGRPSGCSALRGRFRQRLGSPYRRLDVGLQVERIRLAVLAPPVEREAEPAGEAGPERRLRHQSRRLEGNAEGRGQEPHRRLPWARRRSRPSEEAFLGTPPFLQALRLGPLSLGPELARARVSLRERGRSGRATSATTAIPRSRSPTGMLANLLAQRIAQLSESDAAALLDSLHAATGKAR